MIETEFQASNNFIIRHSSVDASEAQNQDKIHNV